MSYFSENYGESRDLFLAAADRRGFRTIRHRVPAEGYADLFIDFALLKRDPNKVLVHISGTHGIEGYVGSAVQRKILEETSFTEDGPSILFVHALNPYGMAFYRRANSNNVDLNRNSLRDFSVIKNEDYRLFSRFLNPNTRADFLLGLVEGLINKFKIGMARTSQAIASGQNSHPHGLFYVGDSLQREISFVCEFLRSHFISSTQAVVLDVHSGLGEFGREMLFPDNEIPTEEREFFEKAFARGLDINVPEDGIYTIEGSLSEALRAALPRTKLFYVLQEFGTHPAINVLKTMAGENFEWRNRDKSAAPSDKIKNAMLEAFVPKDQTWRERTLGLGAERFAQALRSLNQS